MLGGDGPELAPFFALQRDASKFDTAPRRRLAAFVDQPTSLRRVCFSPMDLIDL